MSNAQALLDCTFGWGKICRLYPDSIEIAGRSYKLDELTAICPTYRNIFGVPSARLELFFGPRHLVLRGIPDLETVRLMVAHLQPYCSADRPTTRARSRSAQARRMAREQARTWERSSKLPAIPVSPQTSDLPELTLEERLGADCEQKSFEDARQSAALDPSDPSQEEATSETADKQADAQAVSAEASEPDKLAALSSIQRDSWPFVGPQSLHTPRFQPPLRSVHLVAPGQKRLDTGSIPVPAVKSSVLPIIHVPVRLQPGECAHYSIGAALCSDRISGSDRAPYPPLDHGLLILTNRRIFYIGKRSQLILAYTHLWYVSLLRNAIALHIEKQFRRIIIELEHPHEWASRIEQLSFIARREQPRPELPTLLMAALPGLASSSLDTTLKRPAIKAPARKVQKQKEAETPLLPERVTPGIVEAQTVSLSTETTPSCVDEKTQDLSSSSSRENDAVPLTPPPSGEANEQPQATLATMNTRELPPLADLAEAATQELARSLAVEESPTQKLLIPRRETERKRARDEEEVTTGALVSPAASRARDGEELEEIETLPLHGTTGPLENEETQPMTRRKRRAAHAEEYTRAAPISDSLPDIDVTPRCLTRRRGTRPPAHAKATKPN